MADDSEIKVGDLVRVVDGTHDPAMPAHRTGLIVEVIGTWSSTSWIYMVQFGTSILRFHGMFLEKVSE